MAIFSMRMQVIKRSAGRSSVAAAAYRAGEKLVDERQGITHDYSNRTGVEHREILFPDNAPAWVRGMDRAGLWNAVEAGEKRKDSQTARELRLTLPREIPPHERIALVRDYVRRNFVARGMIADIAIHNKVASDGLEQPHAHVMLTMRPAVEPHGFGQKMRHDWVPCPSGRTHDDGRPVMVESNAQSWNSIDFYEATRLDWENTANAALARAGSEQRIDRRSLLERGLARMPEPALRLAFYLKDLKGSLRERFGQFQMAKHYQAVESRAKAAFDRMQEAPTRAGDAARNFQRFYDWFDRQLDRLAPARDGPGREPPRHSTHDMER